MDIFALIIICGVGVDCMTIHDRIAEYTTIEQCVQDIPNLQRGYKTKLVTCHEGDMIKDNFAPKTKGA